MPGIYVHIPFCVAKCGYCDFHSIIADEEIVGIYINACFKELEYWAHELSNIKFDTLFIGGGTPTVLSQRQLAGLLEQIFTKFTFVDSPECSIESNPKTLDYKKVKVLKDSGINRVSLGAQAFQNNLLEGMGRVHNVAAIYESVDFLQRVGIDNYNLDLMYGLPQQLQLDWEDSLAQALKLEPTHLSCYSLIVEEDTPFFQAQQQGMLHLPDEEDELSMFTHTHEYLKAQGFHHYEISNFARPDKESRHNTLYWLNQSYLGIGSGAHGFWGNVRYANTLDIKKYIDDWSHCKPTWDLRERITADQLMDETMMVGLRLLTGVNKANFSKRFGHALEDIYGTQLRDLTARELIEEVDGFIRLTQAGLYLGNLVFSAFIR